MSLPRGGVGFLPVLVPRNLGKHIFRCHGLTLAGTGGQREPRQEGVPGHMGKRTPSFTTARLLGEGVLTTNQAGVLRMK